LKILQVIARLDSGGAERVFVDTCNMLYENGNNVNILFTRSPGILHSEVNPKIPYISLDRKNRFSFLSIYRMSQIIINYDIIHVHLRYNLLYLKCALFFTKKCSAKIIFHDHYGPQELEDNIPFYFNLIKKNFLYVGVSESLSNWAIDTLKMNKNNVKTLPNIRLINNINTSSRDVGPGTLRLVHVSNIHPIKNLEFSLEIVRRLNKSKDVHLTIYGNKSDEEYYSRLINLINDYKISDKVDFVFDENNIPSILDRYDFGLYTSKSESGPLVVIEYLSQGLPFITYETGEVIEQIKEILPFTVMKSFDIDEWSHQIEKVLSLDISDKLTETFKNIFSPDNYCKKLIDIYNTELK